MRIFLTLYPAGNSSVPGSMTWYRNFYETLVDLGHDVFLFRIDLVLRELGFSSKSREFKEKFSEKLLSTFIKEHKKIPFDFFLSYLIDLDVEASVIDEIKRAGVPTANFSCNNTHQFYVTKNIAPHFDYNLHSEKDAAEKFKSIGAEPIWFPMAANPEYYHPMDFKREIDVLFIGALYAKRAHYIWHLLEGGMDVQCFGPNWLVDKSMSFTKNLKREMRRNLNVLTTLFPLSPEKRCKYSSKIAQYDFQKRLRVKYNKNLHHPISDEEMIVTYNKCKIALGFLEVFDNHDASLTTKQHLHLREFEVPMCGALYFTNYCDELAEFYEPDKEVIVYRNEHELLEKVKYYLSHPEEAEKVRQAGYKRALECHTYQKRFEELFSKLHLEKL